MDKYKKIAKEVDKLLTTEAGKKRFVHYLTIFKEQWTLFDRASEDRKQKIKQYRQNASKDKRLRNQKAGPPQKVYVWWDESLFETGDPTMGFWGPPDKELPSDPICLFIPVDCGVRAPKDVEEPLRNYVLLAVLRDMKLKNSSSITDEVWPEALAYKVQHFVNEFWGPGRSAAEISLDSDKIDDLESFLEKVKADLSKKKLAVTEQDTTAAKDRSKTTGSINIENFHGIIGDVQAENVQTGEHSSIHKQPKAENQNKLSVLKILGWLLAQVKWLFTNFWSK